MEKIKWIFAVMLICILAGGIGFPTFATTTEKEFVDNNHKQWFDYIIEYCVIMRERMFSEGIFVDEMLNIDITIGGQVFPATFVDNDASRALIMQMPFTVNMADFNGQEKVAEVANLSTTVTTEKPKTIYSGEIYAWSGNNLVLFYNTFPNAYGGYVRLGTIENIQGLKEALGDGNASVTFEFAD